MQAVDIVILVYSAIAVGLFISVIASIKSDNNDDDV